MASRLAKRNGDSKIDLPSPPTASHVRSLFEIALENAVEGCVRETYGAVCGLVDAETTGDRSMQQAMRAIATDECRHADLAWSVHSWISPQLSAVERKLVEVAMKGAILRHRGARPAHGERLVRGPACGLRSTASRTTRPRRFRFVRA